jgi:ribosomal protein L37E
MVETPPFVRWTLALACPLREDSADVSDPELTERQLRSLRGYSDAVHKGRLFDGICLAPGALTSATPLGFPALEVLNAYGGETFVAAQCPDCPANVLRQRAGSGLAGCFGLLPYDSALAEAWEEAIGGNDGAHLFLATSPRWFGLWAASPLSPAHLESLESILAALVHLHPAHVEFHQAVRLARQQQLALHVQANPTGSFDEQAWRIAPHCQRCKATMNERQHRCSTCGLVARAEPARQRKPRGLRPYVPLARFLGESGAAAFLARYAAHAATQSHLRGGFGSRTE